MHTSRRDRLRRIGLIIWLLLPVAVVVALWLAIDRSQGRPAGERGGGSDSPSSAAEPAVAP